MKRTNLFVRMFSLILCLCMILTSCGNQSGSDNTDNGGEKPIYTVTVLGVGGMPLSGVGVYIYSDSTQEELVWFERTNAEGKMTFQDGDFKTYVAVLHDVPSGYEVEEFYAIKKSETTITLTASSQSMEDEDVTRALGELMCEFSVTDTDGNMYSLASLLAEKSVVVLNFWYLECDPCRLEFPYLQAAYEQYASDVAVLAINPVNNDEEGIRQFKSESGYTFPMANGSPNWAKVFGITGYPTTVVVDRNGVITMIHSGAVVEEGVFESVFQFYSAEDYTTSQVMDLSELLSIMEKEDENELETTPAAGLDPSNPLTFGGVTQFEVSVPAGTTIYVDAYRLSGMVGSIKNDYAQVIYNNKTYEAQNGTVSFTIPASTDPSVPASLALRNTGSEDAVFTVNFYAPSGTQGNPVTMTLGNFSTNVSAGNDQGVYYLYTAEQDGVLTINKVSCTNGVECDVTLYNLNSYAYRTMAADGEGDSVSVSVKKDDRVQVVVSVMPDGSGNYPAATIQVNASFSVGEAGESQPVVTMLDYTIKVTDTNGQPVRGVSFTFTVDDAKKTVTTDSEGKATISLPAGSYNLTMTVPIGYTSAQTAFALTEQAPNLEAVLTPEVQDGGDTSGGDGGNGDAGDVGDGVEDYTGVGEYYEGYGFLYPFQTGAKRVPLNAGGMTYFTFEVEIGGTYRFKAVGNGIEIGYYGTPFFIFDFNAAGDVEDNSFSLDVQGGTVVIGILADPGVNECVLEISYEGEVVTTEKLIYDDAAYEPGEFDLAPGKVLTQVDVTSASVSDLVLGDDGYYYLNGKLVLVDLAWGNLSLADLVYKTGFVSYFDPNGDGVADYIEEYNASMREYVDYVNGNSDTGAKPHLYVDSTGAQCSVYPLNAELMYMICSGGEYFGWWNKDSVNLLSYFEALDYQNENAWMAFLVTAE